MSCSKFLMHCNSVVEHFLMDLRRSINTLLPLPLLPFSLVALNRSDSDFSDPVEILALDRSQVELRFGNSRTLTYSPAVDDGFWHHVAVTWDSNQGAANLYVDGQLASVAGSYHTLQTVRPL